LKKHYSNKAIRSERLAILNCTPEILRHALAGDMALSELLDVVVIQNWASFGMKSLRYTLERLQMNPKSTQWWTYLCIDEGSNTLIGSGGYKGPPDNGMVEIGYGIAPEWRNRGYATEFACALLRHAFDTGDISRIQAHTMAEENASVHVLKKCGFTRVATLLENEEGAIWKWLYTRD